MTARWMRDGTTLRLEGRWDGAAAAEHWEALLLDAREATALDLAAVEALDPTASVLVLLAARDHPCAGASADVQRLLDRARAALAAPRPAPPPKPLPPVAALGRWGVGLGAGTLRGVAFLGEATLALGVALLRPWRLQPAEVLRHLDEAGTRAFALVALLGVLIGVILAFQSSIPMRQFGAEIFIPRLVGISLIRELGPLMAAVILAGRTGSAFAAEIGTMTVNEEVDALRIMGIDPMAMLVVPRLIAGLLVMPVLALLMNLSGLLGMGLVMAGLGYPPLMVASLVEQGVTLTDLLGGLFKAAVFGLAIAAIGCAAGLGAGRGPRAVGDAATSAVVGGIVAIVLLDGLFAVLFFRLNL
jgi:phospholipid/cholesterol/gamma-HCH transport system permease protein